MILVSVLSVEVVLSRRRHCISGVGVTKRVAVFNLLDYLMQDIMSFLSFIAMSSHSP